MEVSSGRSAVFLSKTILLVSYLLGAVTAFSVDAIVVVVRRSNSGRTVTAGFSSLSTTTTTTTTTTRLLAVPGEDGEPSLYSNGDHHDTTITGFYMRNRVKKLTQNILPWSESGQNGSTTTTTNGSATRRVRSASSNSNSDFATMATDADLRAFVDETFGPAEESLRDMEDSLATARTALETAKARTYQALDAASEAAATMMPLPSATDNIVPTGDDGWATDFTDGSYDLDSLSFEDIDYESSEMAPPFLDQDSCLMPDAAPVVRVERAPENSRRIFAGIDMIASTDDVWNILTNYQNLQNVIPNLVVNDVLDLYGKSDPIGQALDESLPEEIRCANLSKTMRGSLLRQVGGAKVAGINFSAKTTLEVREWPTGMPDFAHFLDEMWEGKSRDDRAREYSETKLKRYRFPRPFAVSNLPTRDISMQSIANDSGEFRLYQGVWRMQPLVGCAPPGQKAMRLTYAVEISPRVYLPVRLIEGRIVADLCANLEAIRGHVTALNAAKEEEDKANKANANAMGRPNGTDRSILQAIEQY